MQQDFIGFTSQVSQVSPFRASCEVCSCRDSSSLWSLVRVQNDFADSQINYVDTFGSGSQVGTQKGTQKWWKMTQISCLDLEFDLYRWYLFSCQQKCPRHFDEFFFRDLFRRDHFQVLGPSQAMAGLTLTTTDLHRFERLPSRCTRQCPWDPPGIPRDSLRYFGGLVPQPRFIAPIFKAFLSFSWWIISTKDDANDCNCAWWNHDLWHLHQKHMQEIQTQFQTNKEIRTWNMSTIHETAQNNTKYVCCIIYQNSYSSTLTMYSLQYVHMHLSKEAQFFKMAHFRI